MMHVVHAIRRTTIQRTCFLRQRSGSATVELAMVVPILLMLVFCGFEFSRANLVRNMASSAAYEGARQAVVAGATASDAQTAANDVMNSMGVASATVTVTPTAITALTPSVHVHVAVPYSPVTGFGADFLDNLQIEGECELTREGFATPAGS